ncbi:hypothetical protein KK062_03705 [Fulvivirgaceae bacterium PWU5]|uniref:Uncharacterized protein n=1 Tax=Dawidia cretensis TaxID=2782350 RepID=A0AAP2GNL6_9BACT|nr:hypothetical protein [Dawidia cretensis]MBT1707309.1 hypothetical protein [Dawidia cretensis]
MKEQTVLTIAMTAGAEGCPLQALLKTLPETAAVYTEPGLTVLRVAPGVLLELHGMGSCIPAHFNEQRPVLLSFRVGDLKSTVDLLISKGATVLLSAAAEEGCMCMSHVQLANGQIFGFFEEKVV